MFASPLFLPAQSSAPQPESALPSSSDLPRKPWWKGITADGFASLSYTHNTNDPSAPRASEHSGPMVGNPYIGKLTSGSPVDRSKPI